MTHEPARLSFYWGTMKCDATHHRHKFHAKGFRADSFDRKNHNFQSTRCKIRFLPTFCMRRRRGDDVLYENIRNLEQPKIIYEQYYKK